MTTEGPAPEGRSNTGLIILGLAAVLLIGTVVGLLLGGDGESADTTLATGTSTPTTVATTASTVPPTTTTAPSTTTTPPPPEQFAFAALEDTTIDSGAPNEILGAAELLQIEQEEDDIVSALVRFEVTGLPADAEIASAVLQLSVVDASSVPGVVSQVGGPWSEAETTWATAPPVGVPVTTLPGGTEGAPLSIDLTSLVTGPGLIDLYLTTSSDDGMDFASRESAAGAPTLVVTPGRRRHLRRRATSSSARVTLLVVTATVTRRLPPCSMRWWPGLPRPWCSPPGTMPTRAAPKPTSSSAITRAGGGTRTSRALPSALGNIGPRGRPVTSGTSVCRKGAGQGLLQL